MLVLITYEPRNWGLLDLFIKAWNRQVLLQKIGSALQMIDVGWSAGNTDRQSLTDGSGGDVISEDLPAAGEVTQLCQQMILQEQC